MRATPPWPGARHRLAAGALVAGVVGLLGATTASAAPEVTTLTLDGPPTGEVGQVLTVTVAVVGAVDVFADELSVALDPTVLELVDATTPAGGYSDVGATPAGVRVVDTRLGTSPALAGDLTLLELDLRPLAPGPASIGLAGVTLVGSDGATTVLTDVAALDVVVAPAATPTPSPTPTSVPSPTPAQPGGPSATPTPGVGSGSTPTPSPSASPAAGGGGPLASTGATVGVAAAVAVALVAVGTFLVRRRAAAAR